MHFKLVIPLDLGRQLGPSLTRTQPRYELHVTALGPMKPLAGWQARERFKHSGVSSGFGVVVSFLDLQTINHCFGWKGLLLHRQDCWHAMICCVVCLCKSGRYHGLGSKRLEPVSAQHVEPRRVTDFNLRIVARREPWRTAWCGWSASLRHHLSSGLLVSCQASRTFWDFRLQRWDCRGVLTIIRILDPPVALRYCAYARATSKNERTIYEKIVSSFARQCCFVSTTQHPLQIWEASAAFPAILQFSELRLRE